MSLLKLPTQENATGEVKEIFLEVEALFSMVPNGLRLWSANPKALRLQWNHIKEVMSKDEDTQKLHALIRYLVSNKNGCEYCIGLNKGMLINFYAMKEEQINEIESDLNRAPLNEKNKALLSFAMKSVRNPESVNSEDLAQLKLLNISEIEMFDIAHAAAHMLVINTLFETFNVEAD